MEDYPVIFKIHPRQNNNVKTFTTIVHQEIQGQNFVSTL